MSVKKACWLPSSHTQMDDMPRESHTHTLIREASFLASSERKWD